MDKEQFQQELTKVAEWRYSYVTDKDASEILKPGPNADKKQIQPQLGPRVIQFHKSKIKCDYCEDRDSHIGYQKLKAKTWQAYCYTCKYFIDPKTGIKTRSNRAR